MRPIYLDYNATTPVDKRVLDAMLPWFTEHFGNAASRTHLYGWEAEEAVETARKQVAQLLNANAKEVVFTSGATEANNLTIKGLFDKYFPKKKHIVTLKTEHKAVLDPCRYLEKHGAEVSYLIPNTDGTISPQAVAGAMRDDTFLVSVMWANNETGVLQNIKEIAEIVHKYGAYFHTDATQAVGKISIDFAQNDIDLLSLSAHKFYGPKGIGALVVKKSIEIEQLLHGGGHERGRRSGTLNVPAIVGMGMAAKIAKNEINKDTERLENLRNYLEINILQKISNTFVNGNKEQRLPNTTNICFDGRDGEQLLMQLKNIAASNGSACTSASVLPSHVLKALGLSDDQAHASIRFSLGRFTTQQDIDMALENIEGQCQ